MLMYDNKLQQQTNTDECCFLFSFTPPSRLFYNTHLNNAQPCREWAKLAGERGGGVQYKTAICIAAEEAPIFSVSPAQREVNTLTAADGA